MRTRKNQSVMLVKLFNFMVLTAVWLIFLSTIPVQDQKFLVNPTERCEVQLADASGKSPYYFINGDKGTRYNRMNEKQYIYLIPTSEKVHINNKEVTEIKMGKYRVRETNGWFFIDGEKVGSLTEGDVIILHEDEKVHVYNEDRVSIK